MLIFKKEKAVIELIFRHIDKSAECVQATLDSVRAYVADHDSDSTAAVRLVNSLESEADTLLREIREMLYSGAYLPQIRGDIYRLMSAIDRVSNKAEDCFDYFHYQVPEDSARVCDRYQRNPRPDVRVFLGAPKRTQGLLRPERQVGKGSKARHARQRNRITHRCIRA